MMNRTPTPWRNEGHFIKYKETRICSCFFGSDLKSQRSSNNSRHIVKCVNAHEELVEFVKDKKGCTGIVGEEATKLWEKYGDK